jgi:hypothetical protein
MNYNYNKNEYLHIVETFSTSTKQAPEKQIPMRIAPRTLESIDEFELHIDNMFYGGNK